jgi:hypothetical protein
MYTIFGQNMSHILWWLIQSCPEEFANYIFTYLSSGYPRHRFLALTERSICYPALRQTQIVYLPFHLHAIFGVKWSSTLLDLRFVGIASLQHRSGQVR